MNANPQEENRAVAAKERATPHQLPTLPPDREDYGVDIRRVQEVRAFEPPMRLAGAPPHGLGVTGLRHITGIGTPGEGMSTGMPIPVDIDALMSRGEVGLAPVSIQQPRRHHAPRKES